MKLFILAALLIVGTAFATTCPKDTRAYPGNNNIPEFTVSSTGECPACLNWTPGPPTGGGGNTCAWTYSKDAQHDSTGGNIYEIYGLGFHYDPAGKSTFVISAGHPLTGTSTSGSVTTSIDAGDLIINFGDKTYFPNVDGSENVFGIHFTPDSDSPTQVAGVYSNVKTSTVTASNTGHITFQRYLNSVNDEAFGQNCDGAIDGTNYFDKSVGVPTSIATGNRVGGFEYLVFPEDLSPAYTLQECRGNKKSTRFCKNNPNGLSYIPPSAPVGWTPSGYSICTDPAIPDVSCVNYQPTDGFQAPASWDHAGWSSPNVYSIGIRVDNSVFGDLNNQKASFRACFQIECGNDVACIDAKLDCSSGCGGSNGGGNGGDL